MSGSEVFMARALTAARNCRSEPGKISPLVGVVVVKDGEILAEAYRGELAAGHHAEYAALELKLAGRSLVGADVYTTLEPCTSRNSPKVPCARRLIERGVSRVFIGMHDPDLRVHGRGVFELRAAGIDV